MEGAPTPEYLPTKAEIVSRLEEEGLTDATKEMVIRWTEVQEKEVRTARDGLLLNIQRVEFYEAAKDLDAAFECAREAYEEAVYQGEFDVVDILIKKYPSLEI